LTSDASGNGTWQALPSFANINAVNQLQSKVDEMKAVIDAQNEKIKQLENAISELRASR